jgi:hypothetical protein
MSTESTPEPYRPPAGTPRPDTAVATLAQPPAKPSATPQPQPVTPPLHGPWPAVSAFDNRWPGPVLPAAPATAAVLLVAAVVAAVSIPLDRGGAGWLVTALTGTVALIVARLIPQHPRQTSVPWPRLTYPSRAADPARFGWAAATVALLGAGTIRSAGWLVLLCLATALLTGALAVAGGRSVRAMATASLMSVAAGFRSLPWLSQGFRAIRGHGPGTSGGTRVAATVAVSVALLVVFGTLFASADAAFAEVLSKAVPDVNGATVVRWTFVFAVAIGILGGAAYLRAAPPDLSGMDGAAKRRVTRLEWAVPLGLLVLLFAMFVTVQLAVLFGGSRHVLDTDGLTYADYARGGFWQLLVVTGLTLLVLAGAARWAPRTTRADRVLIRVILGALAVLTLVVVASATHRMDVYAGTYGLTRLRILVALCELWLGVVFLMVLIAGIRLRAAWLARSVVAAGVLALLGLAAANPDGLIADRNITRFEQTGRIDRNYLAGLSADAVPAIERLEQPHRDCVLASIAAELPRAEQDWRSWSYGRAHARELFAANPPVMPLGCETLYRW